MEIIEARFTDPEGTAVSVRAIWRGETVTMAVPAIEGCRHWELVRGWAEEPGNEILPNALPSEPTPDERVAESPMHTDRVLRAFAEVVAEQMGMTPAQLKEAVKAKLGPA